MKNNLFILLTFILLISCKTFDNFILSGPDSYLSTVETESGPAREAAGINPIPDRQNAGTIFYPMLPQKPRLQFMVSITREKDMGIKQDELRENPSGEILYFKNIRPYDIGSAKGKIYISDRNYRLVFIIDLEKKEMNYIKKWSNAGIHLIEPAGIWVTEDDYKYVADFRKKQIVVFDKANNFLRAYGRKSQFDKPIDVAVYQNKIYVCDLNKHQIIVIDKNSGETIQEIGGIGVKEGHFYKPTHVIVDMRGNIYVNDFFNFRIQKFEPDGNFIKSFGFPGDTLGSFGRPKGLDKDKEGHLYVVDASFENVQIFDDKTAELLLFFGEFGSDPGNMYLPNGLHIDYQNIEYFNKYADKNFSLKYLVYVGNMWGERKLNVYGFGEWTGPPLTNPK